MPPVVIKLPLWSILPMVVPAALAMRQSVPEVVKRYCITPLALSSSMEVDLRAPVARMLP